LFSFCSIIPSLLDNVAMHQPNAQSVMRNRAAVAEELRRLLPQMERLRASRPIPFGLDAIDRHLPQGGLLSGALHEIVPEEGATPAAFGFLVALLAQISSPPPERGRSASAARQVGVIATKQSLHSYHPTPGGLRRSGPPSPGEGRHIRSRPLLLVLPAYGLRDYGRPHGHGFNSLGLDPDRLILVEATQRIDMLWAMEEALRSRAPAAVAGVLDKLDLKTSQRLQLAATDCGLPLFLLRPAEMLDASAAATRWRVGPAPAARDRFGLITRARWRLALERCRNGRTGFWTVEYDHVAHRFSLAAALADPAFSQSADAEPYRQAS
jgi:protein ImuA